MKKGGKTKIEVTHVPRLLPPTSILPSVDLPLIELPLYHGMWLVAFT